MRKFDLPPAESAKLLKVSYCNKAVIKGWDEGVPQMSLGEQAKLNISSDFGYGVKGAPGAIPPNSDLIFDVELLKIN